MVSLRRTILDVVDSFIELEKDNIQHYLNQDAPFTEQDERCFAESQANLLEYVRFSKAFAAGIAADKAMLVHIIEYMLEMEES